MEHQELYDDFQELCGGIFNKDYRHGGAFSTREKIRREFFILAKEKGFPVIPAIELLDMFEKEHFKV